MKPELIRVSIDFHSFDDDGEVTGLDSERRVLAAIGDSKTYCFPVENVSRVFAVPSGALGPGASDGDVLLYKAGMLSQLQRALKDATECGLLDDLASHMSPSSIEEFCDTVDFAMKQIPKPD